MPMVFEPLLGFGQELSAAFGARNPYQGKLAASIGAAHMLETQEVERIGLSPVFARSPRTNRPKRITRVFSSAISNPNFPNRSVRFFWNSSASRWYWKFTTKSSANLVKRSEEHTSELQSHLNL